jgi:hypothetical protein
VQKNEILLILGKKSKYAFICALQGRSTSLQVKPFCRFLPAIQANLHYRARMEIFQVFLEGRLEPEGCELQGRGFFLFQRLLGACLRKLPDQGEETQGK